jgi:hypothetical protein
MEFDFTEGRENFRQCIINFCKMELPPCRLALPVYHRILANYLEEAGLVYVYRRNMAVLKALL